MLPPEKKRMRRRRSRIKRERERDADFLRIKFRLKSAAAVWILYRVWQKKWALGCENFSGELTQKW